MLDGITKILERYAIIMKDFPWVVTLTSFVILILFAWLTNSIFKKLILKLAKRQLSSKDYVKDKELNVHETIIHLVKIVPLAIIIWGIKIIPGVPDTAEKIIDNVSTSFIILILAITLNSVLNIINIFYRRKFSAKKHSIKGYLQLIKIIISIVTAILIISELIDRSPVILLSGLGAMAAVLMLVFQDTLLSLVASIQISSGDMMRVGDWIEMPNLNADGEVIDIALHTVKVQNWDNTITTLPTRKLITDPFKNWRNMEESGGRRIKSSIRLNQTMIRCLSKEEIQNLKKMKFLKDYWEKEENKADSIGVLNVAAFCAYVETYLKSSPNIQQEMILIVRQLPSGSEGLPIEFYCFSNNTAWVVYESIKAEILNHLFGILPEFGLEVFQSPSGADLRSFISEKSKKASISSINSD